MYQINSESSHNYSNQKEIMRFRLFTIPMLIGMFLFLTSQVAGQTGTVRGNIFDELGEPIIYGTVRLSG